MRNRRRLAWRISLGMTAALMAAVLLLADVRFATNDDAPILRAFMGYESGEAARVHVYLHGFLGKPCGWLSRAFPSVPWYSWMQLALMALALTVIGKSLMQCFIARGLPLWVGALTAAAFNIGFGLEYTAVFTFTQTAAFLGAAAVLQLMSLQADTPRGLIGGCAGAAALAALAYCLRQSALLPIAAICALAFVYRLWEHRPPLRRAGLALCVIALVLGAAVGYRQIELSDPAMQDYLEWQDANGYLIDYYGLGALTEEEIALSGWSEATLDLAREWCFLDEDLNAENFARVTEAVQHNPQPPLWERLKAAKRLLFKRALGTADEYHILLAFAVPTFALCAIGALFQRGKRLRLLFTLGALAAGVTAMVAVLALQGRVPLRAVLTVALPALALLMGLLPACLPNRRGVRALLAVLCAALLTLSAQHVYHVRGLLFQSIRGKSAASTAFTDAESYALAHPDSLFILHGGVSGDNNAFPDYSHGMPHNVTFWGHWGMRSPENAALFERFGIDVWHFDPAAFLREDVFFIVEDEAASASLQSWLCEKLGQPAHWETVEVCGRVSILQAVID